MFDNIKPAEPPKKKSGLFDNMPSSNPVAATPTVARNLFGESRGAVVPASKAAIESWLSTKSVKTTANRIEFILSGVDPVKLSSFQITEIGKFHVDEATEANRCVDQVVTDFSNMKNELAGPKSLILDAIQAIEEGSKPLGWMDRLKGIKPVDWPTLRKVVKDDIDNANDKMKTILRYHLDPFILGLKSANKVVQTILQDLDNTVNTLDYVIFASKDQGIQDLARRRKEMFSKSHALMLLNKSQLDSMETACEKNKLFATELEMNLKPLIENVMRSALINDTDSQTALLDIHNKLKGIL